MPAAASRPEAGAIDSLPGTTLTAFTDALSELQLNPAGQFFDDLRRRVHETSQSGTNVVIAGHARDPKAGVARWIHDASPRARCRFASISCEGMPESLLESELFGHVRGSFAGAYRDRTGLFESVAGGTLFIDAIEAMSARLQASLVRVVETAEARRIGASARGVCVDVRVIAGTNTDLGREISSGRFRRDLYHHLASALIEMPAITDAPEHSVAHLPLA